MVTHVFNKLLPFLFNMNTLVTHHSLSLAYTNRFCVGMLAVLILAIKVEAALTVLLMNENVHSHTGCIVNFKYHLFIGMPFWHLCTLCSTQRSCPSAPPYYPNPTEQGLIQKIFKVGGCW